MQQKSLGLIEARGLLTAVECADAAVKSANVELLGYEACRGGGWTTIKVVGDVGAVKAAVAAARVAGEKVNGVVSAHVIARPSAGLSVMIANADTVGYQMPTPEVVAPQEDSTPEVAPSAPAEAPVAPVEEAEAPEAIEEPESPVVEAPAEEPAEAIVEEIAPEVEEAPVAEPVIEPAIVEEAEPVVEIVDEPAEVEVVEEPAPVASEVAEEEPSDDPTDAESAEEVPDPVASPAKPTSQNRRKRSQRRKNPPSGTTQPKDPQ